MCFLVYWVEEIDRTCRALGKREYLMIVFLISHRKHMLWPLIWTVSSGQFRWGLTTLFLCRSKLSQIITKYSLISRALEHVLLVSVRPTTLCVKGKHSIRKARQSAWRSSNETLHVLHLYCEEFCNHWFNENSCNMRYQYKDMQQCIGNLKKHLLLIFDDIGSLKWWRNVMSVKSYLMKIGYIVKCL